MLRVAVSSDLHLDLVPDRVRGPLIERLVDALRAGDPDVVILAGDIGNGPERAGRHLAPFALGKRASLLVPGNHDVWRWPNELAAGHDSDGALTLLAARAAKAGFHWLPKAPLMIDGWAFAGSLGWYDYAYREPSLLVSEADYRAKTWGPLSWSDRDFVRWYGRLDDPAAAARFTLELGRDLESLGVTTTGGPPAVAVTHVLPWRELVEYKGFPTWDYFSAFLGTPSLGALYDSLPSLRVAVAGHTHVPRRHVSPTGALGIVSPLGYYANAAEFPRDPAERIAWLELADDGSARELGSILP